LGEFNNLLDPDYAINGGAPPAFNTDPIPIKKIKWSTKEQVDRDKVYLPEKVDTVIEDTIIYLDVDDKDYPGGPIAAAAAYLRRAIALALNDAIENIEIPAIKGHINTMILTPTQRTQILKMMDQLSTANFRILKTREYDRLVAMNPTGITEDTVLPAEVINGIRKEINDGIPILKAKVDEMALKAAKKGGDPNTNDPVTNMNDPTALAVNKTQTIDVKKSAAFQKFFEAQGDSYKPGLFTYHVLCYMPNVILLAYAFAKYAENTIDVYNRVYPDMPLGVLKMYASKFFDFDYSNDLNHVFRNIARGGEPAYVDVNPADLQMDDAMMLVLIQAVAGMLIDGDMRAYTNAGLAVDLEQFKGESNDLFTHIRDDPEKLTIVRYYDLIYSAEEYVCFAKLLPREGNAIELFEHFVANGVYDIAGGAVTVVEPATYQVELNIPLKTPARPGPDMTSNMGLGKFAPVKQTNNSEDPTLSGLTSNFAEKLQPRQLFANEPGAQTAGRRGKTRSAGRRCAPRHTRKRGKRRSPFGEPGPANAGRRGNTPKK
jgi:hypothetical protein